MIHSDTIRVCSRMRVCARMLVCAPAGGDRGRKRHLPRAAGDEGTHGEGPMGRDGRGYLGLKPAEENNLAMGRQRQQQRHRPKTPPITLARPPTVKQLSVVPRIHVLIPDPGSVLANPTT